MISFNAIKDEAQFINIFEQRKKSYVSLTVYIDFISKYRYDEIMKIENRDERRNYLAKVYNKLIVEIPIRKRYPREVLAEYTKENALTMAFNNNFDYEQFHEFFPAMIQMVSMNQYNKCFSCSKKGDCKKDFDCLRDIEDDPKDDDEKDDPLKECKKAIDVVTKMNKVYLEQLEDYTNRLDAWTKEYDKWYHVNDSAQVVEALITGIIDMHSISFITMAHKDDYVRETLNKNRIDKNTIVILDARFEHLDYGKLEGIFSVVFKFTEGYMASKLQQINYSKPTEPEKPKWDKIICVDCRNIVDWKNIGALTDVQIQQINECILNLDKKDDPVPPKPKPEPKPDPEPEPPKPVDPKPEDQKPVDDGANLNVFLFAIGIGIALLLK